jgi:hypothetical protein
MLTNVQPTNGGNYTIVVTNDYGAVTSAPASLVVGTVWLDVDGWETGHELRFRMGSEAGKTCEILIATNLRSWVWGLWRTVTNESGADTFTDTATNRPGRLYRLRQLP